MPGAEESQIPPLCCSAIMLDWLPTSSSTGCDCFCHMKTLYGSCVLQTGIPEFSRAATLASLKPSATLAMRSD